LSWPDVEVTMSSFKIIKLADQDSLCISEFSFRNIGQSGAVVSGAESAGGFVPMGLYQGFNTQDSAQSEVVAPIEISEAELHERISESFNDGLKEGKDLTERGLINVFRALRSSGEAIHNLRDKILRESEDELIKLVMLVARKVIIREISQERSIVAGVIQNAIAGLSAREEITVRINPDDYLLITSGRDELLQKELLNERFQLKPDPSVAAGFCLVATAMGTVDASLEGQMDQIYRSLLEQRTTASVVEET